MPNPRLAGRYAKSLIDLSLEKNQLEEVYKDMQFLQSICKGNRDFVNLLRSPVIKPDTKAKILLALTDGRISIITASFNQLLLNKNRETFLPEIIDAFIAQYKSYKGIYTIKLTTASPVSDELREAIIKKITSTTEMKQVELNAKVDESIIGGFILETGDHLLDASIAYDLNNVKKQFRNNDFIYKIR